MCRGKGKYPEGFIRLANCAHRNRQYKPFTTKIEKLVNLIRENPNNKLGIFTTKPSVPFIKMHLEKALSPDEYKQIKFMNNKDTHMHVQTDRTMIIYFKTQVKKYYEAICINEKTQRRVTTVTFVKESPLHHF